MSVPFMESNGFYRKPQETSAYVWLARTWSYGCPAAAREAPKGKNLDQQKELENKTRALFTKEKGGVTTEWIYLLVLWVQLHRISNTPPSPEA